MVLTPELLEVLAHSLTAFLGVWLGLTVLTRSGTPAAARLRLPRARARRVEHQHHRRAALAQHDRGPGRPHVRGAGRGGHRPGHGSRLARGGERGASLAPQAVGDLARLRGERPVRPARRLQHGRPDLDRRAEPEPRADPRRPARLGVDLRPAGDPRDGRGVARRRRPADEGGRPRPSPARRHPRGHRAGRHRRVDPHLLGVRADPGVDRRVARHPGDGPLGVGRVRGRRLLPGRGRRPGLPDVPRARYRPVRPRRRACSGSTPRAGASSASTSRC